jgi:hypothetical protein
MRVVSFRLFAIVAAGLFWGSAVLPAQGAVVVHEPGPARERSMPSPQALARLAWDDALHNQFGWSFASPKIPTACATGRGDFPAYVAQVVCGVIFGKERLRDFAPLSFAGSAVGGGSGDPVGERVAAAGLGGAPGSQGLDGDNGTTVVPLPAAGWFLVSGLAGLVALRRRATTSGLPR